MAFAGRINNGEKHMKTSTINLRVLGAAVAFASKEETRYYLNGVCVEFEPRRATYAATDGHRLIVYRDDLDANEPANELLGAFIIPTAHCKPFKLGKEDNGTAKIFGEVGTRLTIAHTFVDVTFNPIDGTFPDWRKVVPTGVPSGVVAQYNHDFLAAFTKFAKHLGLCTFPFVAPNGADPSLVWFAPHDNVLGVIMPVRSDGKVDRVAPDWAALRDQAKAA
jgi:DNA polymerase-3 subunit beta